MKIQQLYIYRGIFYKVQIFPIKLLIENRLF